ncbi:MAG: radical SAM family heme chaperone HemW [Nitrospirae bacterium]|nr:radical SAM family heme chaperone HemW [Nitrospirota bacterium]
MALRGTRPSFARYVEAVEAELRGRVGKEGLGGRPLRSIYFGGGTPSLLSPEAIRCLVKSIRESVRTSGPVEVTLEVFPDESGLAKLQDFRDVGVTRVSFGMQSMFADVREALWRGRSAVPGRVVQAASEAGFNNVSLDFIYGRPGQTAESWRSELGEIVNLGLAHLSIYMLSVEEDTPLVRLLASGRMAVPEEDAVARMALDMWSVLGDAGYRPYEISNFARPGFECLHNLAYWTPGAEYLGIGAGAHSCVGGARWENLADPFEYVAHIARGESVELNRQAADREREMREYLYLGLRRDTGVSPSWFRDHFGRDLEDVFPAVMSAAIERKWMEADSSSLRLTPRGRLMSDAVFRDLF